MITLNHLRIIILHSSVPPLSPLPAGVKLLSLEAWGEGAVLVRLENTAVAGRGQTVSLAQVQCCKTIHRFHNRLYNHGEGPY